MAKVSVVSACGAPVLIEQDSGVGYTLPEASMNEIGGVKEAFPVADVTVVEVTDIQSAQEAIAAMGTTLSELMQSLRNAGTLGQSD